MKDELARFDDYVERAKNMKKYGHGLYTFDPTTDEGKMQTLLLRTPMPKSAGDYKGKDFGITDGIIHPQKMDDEETGEEKQWIAVSLQLDDASVLRLNSPTSIESWIDAVETLGMNFIRSGKVRFRVGGKKGKKGGDWFCLQPVLLAPPSQPNGSGQ